MFLVGAVLLAHGPDAKANAPISACAHLQPMSRGSMPAEDCQSFIVGSAHGFNYAMSNYGYKRLYCLSDEASDPATLVNRTLPAFRKIASEQPGTALLVGSLGALMDSFPCADEDTDNHFRGFNTAQVLAWCQAGLENDTESAGCSSFLFGASLAMSITSGAQGAEEWACTPKSGVSSKAVLTMMVDDAIEDLSRQELPAMQVIAEILQREYPCN